MIEEKLDAPLSRDDRQKVEELGHYICDRGAQMDMAKLHEVSRAFGRAMEEHFPKPRGSEVAYAALAIGLEWAIKAVNGMNLPADAVSDTCDVRRSVLMAIVRSRLLENPRTDHNASPEALAKIAEGETKQ